VDTGRVLERSDPQAAESVLLQAIETGHEDWAPAAMYGLGGRRKGRGDDQGARAAYQLAIDTGHHEWACAARYQLAGMLEEEGDQAGAREQYWRLAEIGHEHWGQDAVDHLIPQLQHDDDVQGLRVLHRIAVEKNYWAAPEALVAIGDVLEKRGDHDGARAAYQQAIDDGYHYADDLIERL
jgi:TolA-binding protein